MEKSASRAKGVAFKELLVWLDQQLGRDKLLKALAALPPEYKDIVRLEVNNFGILSSSWYPLPFVHKLLDALTTSMSRQEQFDMAQAASRAIMDITLQGMYKAVIRAFVSPNLYAKFATKLWQSYYDSGNFKVIITEDGCKANCTIDNWSGHHPFVCDMNITAASAIYQAMGLKEVSTKRVACIDEGGSLCRYITSWKARI